MELWRGHVYNPLTMKIACLAESLDHASYRYRIRQYIPSLRERGIEIEPHALPVSSTARIRLFRKLRRHGAVILQRRLLSLPHFILLRCCARRLVYDFDDALFVRDSNRLATGSLARAVRFRRTVRRADLVVAGNDYLQSAALRHNGHSVMLPTGVDPARYAGGSARPGSPAGDGFRVAWIGSSSTLLYLENLLPLLQPLVGDLAGFTLVVISDRFPRNSGVPIERVPWSEAVEAETLMSADAGLMPLFDDPWTRGKCGLKLIQYGAAALPSVYSPVGVNPRIAPPGVAGFAAATPEQWRDALLTLARAPDLRRRMGRAARENVSDAYSIGALEPRLAEILATAARRSRKPFECPAGRR